MSMYYNRFSLALHLLIRTELRSQVLTLAALVFASVFTFPLALLFPALTLEQIPICDL